MQFITFFGFICIQCHSKCLTHTLSHYAIYVCLLLTMPACGVHIHTLAVAVAQAKGLISVVFWPACLDPTVTQVFHHLLKFIAPFEKLF